MRVAIATMRVPGNFAGKVLPKDAKVARTMERALTPKLSAELNVFLKQMVENCIADTVLKRRSGRMFSELRSGVKVKSGSTMSSIVGTISASPYVRLHEYGGDIHPKDAEALTIPLKAALRPDGTPKRKNAGAWRSLGTFIWHSPKTGQGYIVYPRGGNGPGRELVFLYVLVDTAHFKAKLGLNKQIRKYTPELLQTWAGMIVQEWGDFDLWGELEAAVSKTRFGRH